MAGHTCWKAARLRARSHCGGSSSSSATWPGRRRHNFSRRIAGHPGRSCRTAAPDPGRRQPAEFWPGVRTAADIGCSKQAPVPLTTRGAPEEKGRALRGMAGPGTISGPLPHRVPSRSTGDSSPRPVVWRTRLPHSRAHRHWGPCRRRHPTSRGRLRPPARPARRLSPVPGAPAPRIVHTRATQPFVRAGPRQVLCEGEEKVVTAMLAGWRVLVDAAGGSLGRVLALSGFLLGAVALRP